LPDSKQFQRIVNRSHVLQKLRVNKGISRIEISRQLGLDRSTITNLVNPLIDLSIVKIFSEGYAPSKGGRRPVLLGINENFGSILGIDLQVSSFSAVLINLNGLVLKEWSGDMQFSGIVETIKELYEQLKDEIDSFSIPLIGIGVGIPAIVDTEKGYIIKATSFNCSDFDFEALAKDLFPVPVLIDNDANCCAWGQLEKNKDKKLQNFLNIIWKLHRKEGESAPEEIEIGIGIVINGEVYYGSGSSAGELPEDLISREQGDIYFRSGENWKIDKVALKEYLDKLFQYLKPLFYVFDPGEIFFGGQFVHCKKEVEEILVKNDFTLLFPEVNNMDTAYGAASMFMEKLFQAPVLQNDQDMTELQWHDIFSLVKDKMGDT
jgi:ROK family